MACKKCEKAKNMKNYPPTLFITCFCGLARILDSSVQAINGEKVSLPACGRCGAVFNGVYKDGKIEVEG